MRVEPPYGTIIIRAPGSWRHTPKPGEVVIEAHSVTERDERIARPIGEAVPLFWRFIIEKYGVRPSHSRLEGDA